MSTSTVVAPRPNALTGRGDLFESFASSGGSWSCEATAELIRKTSSQSTSRLARWIVDGRIVRFERCHRWFIPAFQFSLPEATPLPVVERAIAELRGVLDEHGIVSWFAFPNSWLDGTRPAELVSRRPEAVIQAARAYRFIANGD